MARAGTEALIFGTRWDQALIGLVVLLGAVIYGFGLTNSPVVEREHADRQHIIGSLARQSAAIDPVLETVLAHAYWQRYPDVRQDPRFGDAGILGLLGAREHYNRYGRVRGFLWGP